MGSVRYYIQSAFSIPDEENRYEIGNKRYNKYIVLLRSSICETIWHIRSGNELETGSI